MKKILCAIILIFISIISYAQVVNDIQVTAPYPRTGANANSQSSHYSNITVDNTFYIPKANGWSLNGGKTVGGAIMYNNNVNRMGIWTGSAWMPIVITNDLAAYLLSTNIETTGTVSNVISKVPSSYVVRKAIDSTSNVEAQARITQAAAKENLANKTTNLSDSGLVNYFTTSVVKKLIRNAYLQGVNDAKVIAKAKADSVINSKGIDPNDLITNSVMNQWVDSKIAGTYLASTSITFGNITTSSLSITLAPVTNATSYTLWKNNVNITTLLPNNLTYNDTGLSANTSYSYSATATDGSKISMPVTASSTTLSAISYTTVADFLFTPSSHSGNYTISQGYISPGNDATSAYTDQNTLLVTPNSDGVLYLQPEHAFVEGKSYQITATVDAITTAFTIQDSISPTVSNNGTTAIWRFTYSNFNNAVYIRIANTFSLTELKIEEQN